MKETMNDGRIPVLQLVFTRDDVRGLVRDWNDEDEDGGGTAYFDDLAPEECDRIAKLVSKGSDGIMQDIWELIEDRARMVRDERSEVTP